MANADLVRRCHTFLTSSKTPSCCYKIEFGCPGTGMSSMKLVPNLPHELVSGGLHEILDQRQIEHLQLIVLVIVCCPARRRDTRTAAEW